MLSDRFWCRISGLSKSISKLIENPESGSKAADDPLSATSTGFMILIARRGTSCSLSSDTLDQAHKRRRAAVHDRNLGAVQFDDSVVDAVAGKSSQQMLHRCDMDALAIGKHGRKRGFDAVAPIGPDLGAGIGPAEHDAAIRLRPDAASS